jgi:O-methyltransferase
MDAVFESDQYRGLLQSALTASLYPESAWLLLRPSGKLGAIKNSILKTFSSRGFAVVKLRPFDQKARESGEDWPMIGYSMIGKQRLANIRYCLETVHGEGIPGDFVECGVWRGGASIFAKGVLNCLGDKTRKVWLCDSFEGMPVQRDEDKADPALARNSYLAVPLEEVRENFSASDFSTRGSNSSRGGFQRLFRLPPLSESQSFASMATITVQPWTR